MKIDTIKQALFTIALLPLLANATIYQIINKNGGVTFSDTPSADSQPFSLAVTSEFTNNSPSAKNTTSTKPLSAAPATTQATTPSSTYTQFAIVSPQDGQTIYNQHQLELKFTLQPNLQTNDAIRVLVDGKPVLIQKNFPIIVNNLDRGQHQLQAQIVNANDKVLMQTSTITVYIHYSTAQQPAMPIIPVVQPLPTVQPLPMPITPAK